MDGRIGLGPVYHCERLIRCRRWQTYAWRTVFGVSLLMTFWFIWARSPQIRDVSIRQSYAALGANFAIGLFGMQIALVLLAAPAATAGAICLDKQRGTLAHMLVTDLSDTEIVLGKFAARLGPVLTLVAAAIPVLGLASMLGGIVPESIFAVAMISIGVAALGCSLALMISVWKNKTQEVLITTYGILGLWLMVGPFAKGLGFAGRGKRFAVPDWIEASDPFRLSFRPYFYPGSSNLLAAFGFVVATLAISAVFTTVAILRLRPVAANPKSPKVRKPRVAFLSEMKWRGDDNRSARDIAAMTRRFIGLLRLMPEPSLDRNPVLWREWRRYRPWARMSVSLLTYYALSIFFSLIVIWPVFSGRAVDNTFAAWVNAFVANFGLLLLCVSSSTALAEERVRDSLDVLLSTPLPTRLILKGKWLGAARALPGIVVWPSIVACAAGVRAGNLVSWLMIPIYILSTGVAIVSLGIALATWQKKVSRAIAICVSIFLLFSVGWLIMILFSTGGGGNQFLGYISPFYAIAEGTFDLGGRSQSTWRTYVQSTFVVSLVWTAAAAGLYLATLVTFNRAFGRMDDPVRAGDRLGRRTSDWSPLPVSS